MTQDGILDKRSDNIFHWTLSFEGIIFWRCYRGSCLFLSCCCGGVSWPMWEDACPACWGLWPAWAGRAMPSCASGGGSVSTRVPSANPWTIRWSSSSPANRNYAGSFTNAPFHHQKAIWINRSTKKHCCIISRGYYL